MATKPIFKIAQELGVPTDELLQRLRAAGINTERSSFSIVDEDVARGLAPRAGAPESPQGALVLPQWMQRTPPRRERASARPPAPAQPVEPRSDAGPPPEAGTSPTAGPHSGPPQPLVEPPVGGLQGPGHVPHAPPLDPPRSLPDREPVEEPPRQTRRPRHEQPERRLYRPTPSAPAPRGAPAPEPPQPGPDRFRSQGYVHPPTPPAAGPLPGPQLGSVSEQRKRLRELRRLRDAEQGRPGGQLLARRRDAEIRALEASLGRRGAAAASGGWRSARSMSLPAAIAAIVLIAGAFLLGGIRTGRENTRRVDETAAAARPFQNTVATARKAAVPIYLSQGDTNPLQTLPSPNADGAPLVFLVKQRAGGWLHVDLPTRPNGSTGWIRASDVSLSGHDYRIRIELASHRLIAWNGAQQIARVPVGVGEAVTPTPSGRYYITELLKQPDPAGTYGPWAFGLSAHSDVLNEFAGADGILGIHGTNYPAGIGTDVSHGCIRMSNRNITRLARQVPVGTPVEITRA